MIYHLFFFWKEYTMGFFDSPRERQGPGMWGNEMKSYQDIINGIEGSSSSFGGLNDAAGVRNKFGLQGSSDRVFNPLRRNLATRRAQSLSSAAARSGGQVANAESVFAPIEGAFGEAFGQLESQAGQAETETDRLVASLLERVLGGQDSFNQNKSGLRLNAQRGKSGAVEGYVNSLSDASTFDDIMSGLSVGARIGESIFGG
jgi:hypothetical protein